MCCSARCPCPVLSFPCGQLSFASALLVISCPLISSRLHSSHFTSADLHIRQRFAQLSSAPRRTAPHKSSLWGVHTYLSSLLIAFLAFARCTVLFTRLVSSRIVSPRLFSPLFHPPPRRAGRRRAPAALPRVRPLATRLSFRFGLRVDDVPLLFSSISRLLVHPIIFLDTCSDAAAADAAAAFQNASLLSLGCFSAASLLLLIRVCIELFACCLTARRQL